ncbi:MAG: KWG repeat protein [uncultured bacterium (gcode 4)]|uniref:KWG repeat protein n=1 Tax=uncultured bacterium (gcode 4) TaxID=1234023 RepID=K2G5U1_9BACT|nr:MAG: KWG repeat protein [uncultured bacterium (gcode 4)]
MSDNFNYGKWTPDWEFLMQFTQEEREEFFNTNWGVLEVMAKVQNHIRWLSLMCWKSQQEISDFLFGEQNGGAIISWIENDESPQIFEDPEEEAVVVISEAVAEEPQAEEEQLEETIATAVELETAEEESEESAAESSTFKAETKIDWYPIVWNLIEGRRRVGKNGRYGFLDENNEEVVRCVYDDVNDYSEWIAVVCCDDGAYGFIDLDWSQITECRFSDALDFSEWLAAVKLNNKWWFIDRTWKLVIKYNYTDAESFDWWKAKVTIWRQVSYINRSWFTV